MGISDGLLKPTLAALHNGVIAPIAAFLHNVALAVKTALVPLAGILVLLTEPFGRLLQSCRLIHIHHHHKPVIRDAWSRRPLTGRSRACPVWIDPSSGGFSQCHVKCFRMDWHSGCLSTDGLTNWNRIHLTRVPSLFGAQILWRTSSSVNHEGGGRTRMSRWGEKSVFNYRLMFCGGMTRKDAVPNYSAMTSVIGEQDQECAVCSDFNQGERASRAHNTHFFCTQLSRKIF